MSNGWMPEHSLCSEDLTKKKFVLGSRATSGCKHSSNKVDLEDEEKFICRTNPFYVLRLRLIESDTAGK